MENELIELIDIIQEEQCVAESDVLASLANVYVKSIMILESVNDNSDISSFDIFQETAPVFGRKNEGIIKRIVLIIPRLIIKLIAIAIDIIIFIAGLIIGAIVLIPTTIGITKYAVNEITKHERIDIDFNPEFILELTADLTTLSDSIHRELNPDSDNPIIDAIKKIPQNELNSLISKIRNKLSEFDKNAYQKTEMTRGEVDTNIKRIKQVTKQLKTDFREIKRYARKNSDNIDKEDLQPLKELTEVLSDWAKKSSTLHKKLKEAEKAKKINPEKIPEHAPMQSKTEFDKQYEELSDWVDKNGDAMVEKMRQQFRDAGWNI